MRKDHIKQLPVGQMPTNYERNSNVVTISIPIFYSEKGLNANFDDSKQFDPDMFQDVVVKGAIWTAVSILTNTDLGERGVPIVFHVEDKVHQLVAPIFQAAGVPEDWVHATSYPETNHKLKHARTGKKLAIVNDEAIDTSIVMLWDSDAFVYRASGNPVLAWYDTISQKLEDVPMVSFYSEDNGGDLSFANWQLRSAGLPEMPDTASRIEIADGLQAAYHARGLPKPDKEHRYGATIFSLPRKHPLFEYLKTNYEQLTQGCSDEGIISAWLNVNESKVVAFEDLFVPILKTDEALSDHREDCIAHPVGYDTKQYQNRFTQCIDGRNRYTIKPRGKRLRFHIMSVPHNPSHKDFSHCAFAQKARKLAWMLDYVGHEVYHYGNELSDVRCTEHVSVTTEDDLTEAYSDFRDQSDFYKFAEDDYAYKMFAMRAEHEIRKRAMDGDFICYVFAPYQKRLYHQLQDLPVHHVESGIGYYQSYMKYKVFESPGLRAYHYGVFGNNNDRYWQLSEEERKQYAFDSNTHIPYAEPPFWDAVIPNSFDVEDFDFRLKKEDYFLYLGRINRFKGIEEAMRIAHACGKTLIVAGQGDFEREFGFKPWNNVELVGNVGVEQRRDLISKALALFCMSRYWEPFGGVHVEAMLSGTPPIASDFGGFVHTVRSGYNGYRVGLNIYEQGLWAAQNLDKLDPYNIRDFGLRFSNEQIALRYDEYFSSLAKMIENNNSPYWIENPERAELDWLDYDRKVEWPKAWITPVDIDA